ncbi:alkaline phosphatase family protein [Paenibacillus sepulcri]
MLKKENRIVLAILMLLLMIGCRNPKQEEQDLMRIKSADKDNPKKVILLLVDSLMPEAIDRGIRQHKLPAIEFLIEHGQYYRELVSSFPTMSVTIDSSLITGKYPDDHHVPGLTWYSAGLKKLINYGTGPMEVARQGINPVLADALIHLNGSHLNSKLPTIYEDLAGQGLTSGSINGLIYRGMSNHTISIPAWVQGPTSLPREIKVKGPDLLALGSLSNPFEGSIDLPDGLFNKMGFNNDFAVEAVKYLITSNKLPDFLYVYLPDLDRKLHRNGPSEQNGVIKVDQQLQSLLQAFGSPEQALKDAVIIIAGDSGMTQILPDAQNPVINIHNMFEDASVLNPGETVDKGIDIVLAVNETMAYVYAVHADRPIRDVAKGLQKDPRIDLIAWKEEGWIYAQQGATAKQLRFKADGDLTDPYHQSWKVEQDNEVLDLKVNAADHSLAYGEYPDVLKRLSGALNSHQGEFLVVTTKPGYELADRSSPTHIGGGGHGSIRKRESLVPLIISGTKKQPQYLRMVDLKAYLLELLKKKTQINH